MESGVPISPNRFPSPGVVYCGAASGGRFACPRPEMCDGHEVGPFKAAVPPVARLMSTTQTALSRQAPCACLSVLPSLLPARLPRSGVFNRNTACRIESWAAGPVVLRIRRPPYASEGTEATSHRSARSVGHACLSAVISPAAALQPKHSTYPGDPTTVGGIRREVGFKLLNCV